VITLLWLHGLGQYMNLVTHSLRYRSGFGQAVHVPLSAEEAFHRSFLFLSSALSSIDPWPPTDYPLISCPLVSSLHWVGSMCAYLTSPICSDEGMKPALNSNCVSVSVRKAPGNHLCLCHSQDLDDTLEITKSSGSAFEENTHHRQ